MAETRSGGRGVSRVLAKLEASIKSGDYYEAHQMYRTLYFRYTSQKQYVECLDLLYKGALQFLNKEQYGSGVDLGLLVVDTLEKATIEDYEIWIQRLGVLLSKITANVTERENLLVRSVKWSSEVSKNKMGHPLMHKLVAQILWAEGNLESARHHYLLSRDGSNCGQMLIQLSQTKGLRSETDLFIAQVVFQQLCLKERTSAEQTFQTYTKYHPIILQCEPPFVMPLLNFVHFLLKALDTGKLSIFKTLCDMYKLSLARDPSYEKYMQKIGILFFGAPQPPAPSSGGLFGGLISQLFQGLEDDEDVLAHGSNQRAATTETDLD